jgi:hypothetical protein
MVLLSRQVLASLALALVALVASPALLGGCKPELDQRASRVDGPRILAVRAEPAEAEPRDAIELSALVVDPTGEVATPSWAFCTARKPLAELGPVSPACYGHGDPSFIPLGAGQTAAGTIPNSACRDFGPEVPQAKPGEPYGRPVDPDPTGGYYLPVSVFVGSEVAVATARLACGVAGAPSEDVAAFRQRYHANANPAIARITVDGAAVADGASVTVPAGSHTAVRVEWPACPVVDACGDGVCGPDESKQSCADDCATPKGCGGAERYLFFDADARTLVVRREAMRVSWFATGGLFDRDRTGRTDSELDATSDDGWQAPSEPGSFRVWVVVRDDRGGAAWQGFTFEVR